MRDVLARLCRRSDGAAPSPVRIVTVAGAATRELLHDLLSRPIDALVLVDHAPFGGGSPPDATAAEVVRDRAQRAVLALELSRRAARTVVLAGQDAGTWPRSLAGLLERSASAGQRADLAGDLAPPPPDAPAEGPAAEGAGGPSLLAAYLAPLFAAPARSGALALAWPRECFLAGDVPGAVLPATTGVAGRGRILAYGPYLPLPAGRWRAKAFLGFSPDIGRMPFMLEADSGGVVDRGFFEAERGGIFTLDLDFTVDDALHPIELRLISQNAAVAGQVALIEVALEEIRSA